MNRPNGLGGSPGGHPFDGRNWQPATTIAEYVANCREGLEKYSDRRAAKIIGWPRIRLFRAKLMASLPESLFEALLNAGIISSKELAAIAAALQSGDLRKGDLDRCPCCGYVLRARPRMSRKAMAVIADYFGEEHSD